MKIFYLLCLSSLLMFGQSPSLRDFNSKTMILDSVDKSALDHQRESNIAFIKMPFNERLLNNAFKYDENIEALIVIAGYHDGFKSKYLVSYRHADKLKQLLFDCATDAEARQIEHIWDILGLEKDSVMTDYKLAWSFVAKVLEIDTDEISPDNRSKINHSFVMMNYYHALAKFIYWWQPALIRGNSKKIK